MIAVVSGWGGAVPLWGGEVAKTIAQPQSGRHGLDVQAAQETRAKLIRHYHFLLLGRAMSVRPFFVEEFIGLDNVASSRRIFVDNRMPPVLKPSAARRAAALCALLSSLLTVISSTHAEHRPAVDTALFLAVDISESVDEGRYRLQIDGIAMALEDNSVIDAITGGANGATAILLLGWADRAEVMLPWQVIHNANDGHRVAAADPATSSQGG